MYPSDELMRFDIEDDNPPPDDDIDVERYGMTFADLADGMRIDDDPDNYEIDYDNIPALEDISDPEPETRKTRVQRSITFWLTLLYQNREPPSDSITTQYHCHPFLDTLEDRHAQLWATCLERYLSDMSLSDHPIDKQVLSKYRHFINQVCFDNCVGFWMICWVIGQCF